MYVYTRHREVRVYIWTHVHGTLKFWHSEAHSYVCRYTRNPWKPEVERVYGMVDVIDVYVGGIVGLRQKKNVLRNHGTA